MDSAQKREEKKAKSLKKLNGGKEKEGTGHLSSFKDTVGHLSSSGNHVSLKEHNFKRGDRMARGTSSENDLIGEGENIR